MKAQKEKTITQEANEIINGPRREAYGDARESFAAIADVWGRVLKRPVTAREVALCMIGLKLLRESNRHGRDNLVDICGYAELAEKVK
jgi:hypothetical protein